MDFFIKNDWLNREGPSYSFKIDHILFIVFAIVVAVFLCLFMRKKDKKTVHIVLVALWIMATIAELSYFAARYYLVFSDPEHYKFALDSMLPLHSCFMFMYICPIALFAKNRIIKTAAFNFLVVVNMIMGFITMFVGCPSPGYSALSYIGLEGLIYHALIFIVPLIMVVTGYYDIQRKDIIYGLSLFLGLALIIWIFDAFTGCDYFYIYDGHNFGILYEISENVPHIVWTLIVMSCYITTAFIIHYLVVFLKTWLINRKKEKEESLGQAQEEQQISSENKI